MALLDILDIHYELISSIISGRGGLQQILASLGAIHIIISKRTL